MPTAARTEATRKAGNGRALIDYVKAKRRENCAICALPAEIREQLKLARDRKISRNVVREWLKADHKREIPSSAFDLHSNGHHDER